MNAPCLRNASTLHVQHYGGVSAWYLHVAVIPHGLDNAKFCSLYQRSLRGALTVPAWDPLEPPAMGRAAFEATPWPR